MPRNLDRRVELIFPVDDEGLKSRISNILNTILSDTTNARTQLSDTVYINVSGGRKINSQEEFFNFNI